MIHREVADGILTLRLAHGKASALDLELCQALQNEFEHAAASSDVRAIVVTGTGNIFSAGVDLPRLINSGKKYVQDFVEGLDAMLRAMFLFPKPAVAAMNGHSIAGGAIIGWTCDYRVMSAGRIGVPEALVGVPFPPLALEIVRFAVPRQHLHALLLLARTVEVAEAKTMGLIDEQANDVLARGIEVAKQMAAITPEAFRLTKRQLREPYLRDAAAVASVSADEIDALWAAAATHDHIREYLAKTIGKKG